MGQFTLSLEGQVAVITGAGRGLGLAYAVEMARRGAAVVVNDIDAACAEDAVSVVARDGGTAVASHDDVSTPAGGASLVASAIQHFGKLDVLVNNAGILRNGFFEDLSVEEIDTVLRVNLASAFYVTQPAWRIMKEQRHGRVVLTSSSSGLFSHQGVANYAATKAGLYGLTKALAFEGQDFGITVNAVLPWATTTIAEGNPVPGHADNWRRLCGPDIPMDDPRRSPAMMAHLVAYLVSDRCSTTGEAFSVCRGRYGRVFVGVADGWSPDDPVNVTAEQVEEHVDQIRDIGRHSVPTWVFDEVRSVVSPLVTRG
jgi:NAD(P)-dependent dehydrogenase (short-subunit alcohol dehydrogenase family)